MVSPKYCPRIDEFYLRIVNQMLCDWLKIRKKITTISLREKNSGVFIIVILSFCKDTSILLYIRYDKVYHSRKRESSDRASHFT